MFPSTVPCIIFIFLSFSCWTILFVAGGHSKGESAKPLDEEELESSSSSKAQHRIIGKQEEFTIRMAEKEDANEMRGLYKLLAEHLAKVTKSDEVGQVKLSDAQIGAHLEAKLMESLVVEVNNELVGYLLYYLAASSTEGKVLHLENFLVKEKFRQRDLADRLFVEMAKKALENNVESIEWTVPNENVGAVKFYNKQPKIVNLTTKMGMQYWRFMIEESNEAVEKKAEEIKSRNNLHVRVNSLGNSCRKHEVDKMEIEKGIREEGNEAGELAKQWEGILAKSAGKHKQRQQDGGHKRLTTKELADLLKVQNNGQNGQQYRNLGSMTVLAGENGPIVGMALFHCNAYSSLSGPYIWLDNLAVEEPKHLEAAGTLIFGELAKIGTNLGAKRIEWMAPEGGNTLAALGGNDDPQSQNAFAGHNAFFHKIGGVNLTKPENGHWVLYRWPRQGFEEKIGKNGKEELGMEKLRISEKGERKEGGKGRR